MTPRLHRKIARYVAGVWMPMRPEVRALYDRYARLNALLLHNDDEDDNVADVMLIVAEMHEVWAQIQAADPTPC
jgi:hypothetical protein